MRKNRRLRQPIERDDERCFGFSVRIDFAGRGDTGSRRWILQAFATEALAPASLVYAGSARNGTFHGFVTRARDSVTTEDRRKLASWLRSRPEIGSYDLGSLVETGRLR